MGRLGGVSGISIGPSRLESPRRYISIRRHIITFRMAMQWRRSDRDGRRDMSLRRIILDCEILEAIVENAGWAAEDTQLRTPCWPARQLRFRSEEHTSELQSLLRISYAVFCLKNKRAVYFQYLTHVLLSLLTNQL